MWIRIQNIPMLISISYMVFHIKSPAPLILTAKKSKYEYVSSKDI